MSTYFDRLCGEFHRDDIDDLNNKFLGPHRAIVVDTDDPLAVGRIKFKCPDMHDYTMLPEESPWAIPASMLGGGKSCGNFEVPCIGDYVWIEFEKNNPYAPVWRGYATPTRINYYPLPFVSQITPPPNLLENTVNKTKNTNNKISSKADYDKKYLPKDGRPMAQGSQTRYGSLFITSAVGYYPIEHYVPPAPLGTDPIQNKKYEALNAIPLVNEPDKKYTATITKYGNMILMSDVGYWWNKDPKIMPYVTRPGNTGEIWGDFVRDREFEVDRWLYMQELINESRPVSWGPGEKKVDWNEDFRDQRRIELLTRYGHKIEMRDVGWGMPGVFDAKHKWARPSVTRKGEYTSEKDPRYLSVSKFWDFRWIKIRTKAGMLFQAYDRGSNPQTDTYVNRPLIEETGHRTEREDKWWWDRDARWMRMVTRHGFKMVLDDRGTSESQAELFERPRGNGFLVKGRRTPGAKGRSDEIGNQKGFFFEFNENDLLNRMVMGSPLGQVIEANDRYQYMMLATALGPSYVETFRGIEENEFNNKPAAMADSENKTHHLKLDLDNEYIRLKSRSGNGVGPLYPVNSVVPSSINQGLEIHDGEKGDGPWVEIVDKADRGLWISHKQNLVILRGSGQSFQYIDNKNKIMAIYNGDGAVNIYASGAVNITSDNSINLSAPKINFSVAPKVVASTPKVTAASLPSVKKPTDRGKTYNGPYKECPIKEIQHTYPP